ncbi:IS66 family transposase, partial [Burkholderia stagnalis]
QEAACMAHARRKLHDLHVVRKSPITTEALERFGALYQIEAQIRGKPPDERRRIRQTHAAPLLDSLKLWFEATLQTLSGKSVDGDNYLGRFDDDCLCRWGGGAGGV